MAKGSQYERDLCRDLSLWWSQDDPEPSDDLFWRTSGSGARATVRGRKGKKTINHCGDICNTSPTGQPLIKLITLECKRGYSKSTVADLLDCSPDSAVQEYEKWFDQAQESYINAGSFSWGLIVKRNVRESLFFIPEYLWDGLRRVGAMEKTPTPMILFTGHLRSRDKQAKREVVIVGMRLKQFLEGTKREDILKLMEERDGKTKEPVSVL